MLESQRKVIGAVPLDILEARIKSWVAAQKTHKTAAN